MSTDSFEAARRALSTAHETDLDLCGPFLDAVPASGVALSILAGRLGQSTVCASDQIAARLDELQFDLGEGPCWTAMTGRAPVVATDITGEVDGRWPMFSSSIAENDLGVASMFAFPLAVGSLDLGALDLYTVHHDELERSQIDAVAELARIAAFQVLRRVLADGTSDADDPASISSRSRREVHQATGIILAQLDVTAEEAALLLRAQAFSSGRSVQKVAADVVARRLDFTEGQR